MNPLLAFVIYTVIQFWRKQYAEEREMPEYVDLGGES